MIINTGCKQMPPKKHENILDNYNYFEKRCSHLAYLHQKFYLPHSSDVNYDD
eukprot:UN19142